MKLSPKSKILLFSLSLIFLSFLIAKNFNPARSSEFTSASATLTNARLSFLSALEGAQTAGSSLVTIDTVNYPSTSVLQLQNRDDITINGTAYTVATTIDDGSDNTFSITAGLGAGDVTDNLAVVGPQTSSLTVRLKTVSALTGGKIRILVPAANNTATSHDDTPDTGGFDFGLTVPSTITCPATSPVAYGTWSAAASSAPAALINIGGVDYHSYTCTYTGGGEVGTEFFGTTYPAFVINNLINPAPRVGTLAHDLGEADTYTVIIQHLNASNVVIDQSLTKVGVVDAVKVSATIAPQLNFSIAGITSGQTVCGVTTGVATTALTVPFGELTIGSFTNAGQLLTVTTNAVAGYSVTVAENDQLGREANACPTDGSANEVTCILDTTNGATHTTSADWIDASGDPGFGYSIQGVTAGITTAFAYNESARTFSAKQFADLAASEAPQTIYSRATVAIQDQANVCYRITPSVNNSAGNYENYIVYTASATF